MSSEVLRIHKRLTFSLWQAIGGPHRSSPGPGRSLALTRIAKPAARLNKHIAVPALKQRFRKPPPPADGRAAAGRSRGHTTNPPAPRSHEPTEVGADQSRAPGAPARGRPADTDLTGHQTKGAELGWWRTNVSKSDRFRGKTSMSTRPGPCVLVTLGSAPFQASGRPAFKYAGLFVSLSRT